jgi:hypothetical protein
MRYALLLVFLAGCGTIRPPEDSGRYFTIQHGTARFSDAYAGAKQHCAKMGMDTQHLGTDHLMMGDASRFQCMPK